MMQTSKAGLANGCEAFHYEKVVQLLAAWAQV